MIFKTGFFIQKNMLLIVGASLLTISHVNVGAQITPQNQTYSGIISETCKERLDRACWIVNYAVLSFEKDSVFVYYKTRGNCSPPDSSYDKDFFDLDKFEWQQIDDKIYITGLDQFEYLLLRGKKLISHKNNGEEKNVEFLRDEE